MMVQLGLDLGVPTINLNKLWADDSLTDEAAIYSAGNALGKYADTLHPSDSGAADIAVAVRSYLGI
jgi:lysophospholipase L1-like esterase